jgi:hypothetical protein
MDSTKLLMALCATGKSIDIVTKGNRTFQISGHPQMQGLWRRHPHKGGHPTRSKVGEVEMQKALNQAKRIKLWVGPLKFRVVSEAELKAELAPFPIGGCGQ